MLYRDASTDFRNSNGAAMTHSPIRQTLLRGSALALCAAGLVACAAPAYPVREGYVAPEPAQLAKPQYPVREGAPADQPRPTPASYSPTDADSAAAHAVHSNGSVETAALATVGAPASDQA